MKKRRRNPVAALEPVGLADRHELEPFILLSYFFAAQNGEPNYFNNLQSKSGRLLDVRKKGSLTDPALPSSSQLRQSLLNLRFRKGLLTLGTLKYLFG
jgi:hypothetical protein